VVTISNALSALIPSENKISQDNQRRPRSTRRLAEGRAETVGEHQPGGRIRARRQDTPKILFKKRVPPCGQAARRLAMRTLSPAANIVK
jgi:hypothetical protein